MAFCLIFTELSQSLLSDKTKAVQYVDDTLCRVAFRSNKKSSEQKLVNSPAEAIVCLSLAYKLPQPVLASIETVAQEKSLLDEAMAKQYERKTSCFLKNLEEFLSKSSLSVGEQLISERFTYLEMPFKSMPQYSAAFTRRTNLAEYCICLPEIIVKPCKVRGETGCEDLLCEEKLKFPPISDSKSVVTSIAKSLGTGLLSGIAGKIGALIFDEIFPPGVPDYFDAVYKEIEKIVNQELTQNTIDEINGQINGIVNWVKITYTNAKKSEQLSKQALTELLQPREAQITTQILGVLMTKRYAESGLCVFMIGAGMHLSILQELAFVNPHGSPSESHYVQSIKDYAKQYADFAKTTMQSIITSRLAMIQEKDYAIFPVTPYSSTSRTQVYSWVDKHTGEKKQFSLIVTMKTKDSEKSKVIKQRDHSMANHKSDVEVDLKKKMQDPEATADLWLKLLKQPLPST